MPNPYGPPPEGRWSGTLGPEADPTRPIRRYREYDEPTVHLGPPSPPPWHEEPTSQRRRRPRRKILLVVSVLVLLAGGGAAAYVYYDKEVRQAPAGGREGDCIKVNEASSTDADVETIGCNDPAALYRVTIRQTSQTCPGDAYDSYTETATGAGRATDSVTLCLTLNVERGECLSGLDTTGELARVACGAKAEARVAKVLTGTANEKACGEAATPVVYPKPPTTICLRPT